MLLLLANAAVFVSPAAAAAQGPVIITSFSTNACDLPAVPKGARVVLFSAYEGDAIASSVIGDEDQETNLINVVIEPGTEPLYIVLSSYESMIWRFTGVTKRVVQVVATSTLREQFDIKAEHRGVINDKVAVPSTKAWPHRDAATALALAGVSGIRKKRVYISRPDCPRFVSKQSDLARVVEPLAKELGQAPQQAYASYSAANVHLPSGLIEKAAGTVPVPQGFDAKEWLAATRFWRGGLVSIAPKQVVAVANVQPYRVLPSQMGIAQLVGSGAVIPISHGAYRVVSPIAHMPPSMGGAHSMTLRFAPGVPLPPGKPGHSCIVQESTNVANGVTCEFLKR